MILVSCDPGLTALFTPLRPQLGRYEVCTTAESIEAVAGAGAAAGAHYSDVESLEALDAFGATGSYDRSRLARLYGGTRVRIAHGWTESSGHFGSVTLLSPYPDASFTRLMPGTMEIRFTLAWTQSGPPFPWLPGGRGL